MFIIIVLAMDYNKNINSFNSTYLKTTNLLYQLKDNIFKHENIVSEAVIKLYFNNDKTTNNFKRFKEIEELLKHDENLNTNYPEVTKQLNKIFEKQNKILENTNDYIKRNSRVKNSLSILYRKIKRDVQYEDTYYKNFVKFITSAMYQQNNFLKNHMIQKELFKYFEENKEESLDYRLNYMHIRVLYTELPELKKLISKLSENTIIAEFDTIIKNYESKSNIYKKDIQDRFYFILAGTMAFFTIILVLITNIKNHLEELRNKDKLIFNQSKHAAMGEMIDAIAHQWAQPINILKMRTELLTAMKEPGEPIYSEEIEEFQEKTNEQLDHMTKTLNEFRNFLRPNKTTKLFSVEKSTESVLLLLNDELIKNQIKTKVDVRANFEIDGIENEFKHVLINLINNSKDAFVDNKIKNRTILIIIDKDEILIQDNAGGIPANLIKRIFEPNFTTKEEGKGTGIGLYMTKQILDKIDSGICARNVEDGVRFTIRINRECKG